VPSTTAAEDAEPTAQHLQAFLLISSVVEARLVPDVAGVAGIDAHDTTLPRDLPAVTALLDEPLDASRARGLLALTNCMRSVAADEVEPLLGKLTTIWCQLQSRVDGKWEIPVLAQHTITMLLLAKRPHISTAVAARLAAASIAQLRWVSSDYGNRAPACVESVCMLLWTVAAAQPASVPAHGELAELLTPMIGKAGSEIQVMCGMLRQVACGTSLRLSANRAAVTNVWHWAGEAAVIGMKHAFLDALMAVAASVVTDAETAAWASEKGAAATIARFLRLAIQDDDATLTWPTSDVIKVRG